MNLEGLKIWHTFAESEACQTLEFLFVNSPRMMQEFWESMPSSFGSKVKLESPDHNLEDALVTISQLPLEQQVQALLTENLNIAIPDQNTASLNQLYLGMLTSICRYALSELFLTREAVLDLSSRIIARCSAVSKALSYTDITRSFDLPG